MQHRDLIVLKKVIDEIDIAEEMLKDVKLEAFLNDEVLKRAVSMTIINIGELIKNVTEETRKKYREVSWKDAAGMRDITAHRYQTLRVEDVYNSANIDFPKMKRQLLSILESEKKQQ